MSNNDQFDDLDDFDDFDEVSDDLDPAPEGLAAEEEDWDQFSEDESGSEPDAENQPAKKISGKKKSGLFNVLLIGGIVLAGAGFMFLQTGGKKAPPPVPAQQEPLIEDQIAEIPDPPATPPMPSPIEQPETQSDPALQDTKAVAAPVVTSTVDGSDVLPAPAEEPVIRMPKAEDILLKGGAESPVAAPPAADQIEPAPQPQDSLASASRVAAAPVAEQVPTASVPDTALLMEKLDALSTRLESLEEKLEAYRQEKPAAADNESDGSDARIDALQQSLARLEDQVNRIPDRPPVSADPKPARETIDPPPVKPVPQILGQSAEEPQTTQAVRSAPAPAWVLKGAQPGRAMVAKKGENDLQPVEVGDTLSGIGRVTAIEYKNGKWSIIGTNGVISQ